MKRILTLTLILGVASASFGQGVISWANGSTTKISFDADGSGPDAAIDLPVRIDAGTTYNFGLFLAPLGTAAPTGIDDANWNLVTAYALNSTAAAGAGRMQNPGNATTALYTPGTTVNFIVRAWQTSSGVADWAVAKQEGLLAFGSSALGSLIVGGGAFPISSAFGVAPGQIGGFTVSPVPEPGSIALAGIGAASLLLFRRRK